MKNSIIKRIAMAGIVGMLGAAGLFAQDGVGRGNVGRERMEKMGERMDMMRAAFASLNLTEEQKAQVAELQEEFRTENEGRLGEIRELQMQAREQLQSGDKEGAAATREQIRAKEEQLKEEVRNLREQIALILTDEQKATLREFNQKHEEGAADKADAGRGDCPGMEDMPDMLNLTDQQKEQIREVREEFQAENAGTMERMKELHEQMRAQMESGDREGAQSTRRELKELRETMKTRGENLRERIGAILTEEQRAVLAEHRDALRECREHRREERKEEKGRRRGEQAPGTKEKAPADIR